MFDWRLFTCKAFANVNKYVNVSKALNKGCAT